MSDDSAAPTTGPTEAEEGPSRPLSLLAKERFGSQFVGDTESPLDRGELAEGEPQEVPPHENEPLEATEGEDPTKAEGEAADAPAAEAAPTEDKSDEQPITSLSELIESQEFDPDWFNSLDVSVKVNGQPATAKLADLVKNYQIDAAANDRLEQAKAKAQTQNHEFEQKAEALNAQFAVAQTLIESAQGLIDSEVGMINWDELRQTDPAEYAAKKSEVAERRQALENIKLCAVETFKQVNAQTQKEDAKNFNDRLVAEHEALLECIPEWRDETKAAEEKGRLAKYLFSQGFTEHDINTAVDHRLILMARKAELYDESQGRKEVAMKKVVKIPKTLKPGSPKPTAQLDSERVERAREKLRKTGSIDDAYALLKAQQGGS